MTRDNHEDGFELGLPLEEIIETDRFSGDAESVAGFKDRPDETIRYPDRKLSDADTCGIRADTPSDDQRFLDETEENHVHHLETIYGRMNRLHQAFEDKIKKDSHKDKIIDQLHQELQGYKEGMIKKHMQSMVLDIIKIIDDIRKLTDYYQGDGGVANDAAKLLTHMEGIVSDLEDVFSWQGVQTYSCDDEKFNPACQRIIKRIDTSDTAMDRVVAEHLRPGYEWDSEIIRPELVTVYHYKGTPVKSAVRGCDE